MISVIKAVSAVFFSIALFCPQQRISAELADYDEFNDTSTAEQPVVSQTRLLKGKVVDKNTELPVSGAFISASALNMALQSGTDGMFSFNIPSASACSLTAQKTDYEQSSIFVESGAADTFITIALEPSSLYELQKMTVTARRSNELPLLTNTNEISQVNISPELVEKLPGAGQADLFRSLQLLPGVTGTNEMSSGLYVRGGTPDQNLIILNKMPIYYVDHFYGFFSAFNPDAISGLTLYKGGFGAHYGGRLSSVVELSSTGKDVTSDSVGIWGGAGIGLLSSDAYLQFPLGNKKNGKIMIAGRRAMTDIIETNLFERLFNRMHETDTMRAGNTRWFDPSGMSGDRIAYRPQFTFWDVNGLATFSPSSRTMLTTTVFASRDDQDNSIDTTWSSKNIYPSINYNKDIIKGSEEFDTINFDTNTVTTIVKNKAPIMWGNICLGQEWEQQWSDMFTTRLNLSYSQFLDKKTEDYLRRDSISDRYSDTTAPRDTTFGAVSWMASGNKITDISARFDNSFRFTDWNTLSAGIEVSRKAVIYERDTMFPDTTVEPWKWMSGSIKNMGQLEPVHNYDTSLSVALYVENEMLLSDKAGLTPGLRLYHFQLASTYALDPRVTGWWKPHPEVKMKAAWGMYTQEIHRAEQEDITGGSKFVWLLSKEGRPLEKSKQLIGGVSWEKKHLLLDAEGYVKHLTGLLTISERMRAQGGAWDRPFIPNELALFEGTGTARGIELLAQVKNVRFPFLTKTTVYNGWAAYTWSRVENTYDVFNNGSPFPATHDHTHEVKLVNSVEWNVAKWSSIDLAAVWIYSTGTPYTAPLGNYSIMLLDSAWWRSYTQVSEKNAYRLPEYHRLDLSAGWKVRFGRRFESHLSVGLFNAYNNENILERTYSAVIIGGGSKDIKLPDGGGGQTTVYTPIDKLAMATMFNAALQITARF